MIQSGHLSSIECYIIHSKFVVNADIVILVRIVVRARGLIIMIHVRAQGLIIQIHVQSCADISPMDRGLII